ncbi:hypothetical protein [Agrobacterium rosae]|uniref:hypothetical protein n=1 Tax=Agrobacterium rosae TaxID=1972867 RepID=UPI003B9E3D27
MQKIDQQSPVASEWPPLKKALWDVVTSARINGKEYIVARDLTDKLFEAALASPTPTGAVLSTDAEPVKNADSNVDYWKLQFEAAEAQVKRYREALHIISAGHACPIALANNALRPTALSSTGDTHGN